MRTVDATLTAALAAGNGIPYAIAHIGFKDGTIVQHHVAISYKLTGTTLDFETAFMNEYTGGQNAVYLERGVSIQGVNYSVSTGRFRIHNQHTTAGRTVTKAALFPKEYYTANGYDTYRNVLSAFCTAYGKTAVFRDPAAAWLDYEFFPDGKSIILNDANSFLTLLRQKYLIFACDYGSEQVLFYSCAGDLPGAIDIDYTATDDWYLDITKTQARFYMWRDELGAVHTAGTPSNPMHNLGYLESTASPPAIVNAPYKSGITMRPDLRVVDGDIFNINAAFGSIRNFALVTEELTEPQKGSKHPRWSTFIEANPVFGNTAGGAMPSTIERVSNYTPLNTSNFNRILSASDNNLQAAMDTLDDYSMKYLTSPKELYRSTGLTIVCFSGTINGAPAGYTIPYILTAGNENDLIQYDGLGVRTTGNLTRMVLRNVTRGQELTIVDADLVAKTISTSAPVPAAWLNGDVITTNAGLGYQFRAIELVDTLTIPYNAHQLLLHVQQNDAAASAASWFQEYATAATSKTIVHGMTPAAGVMLTGTITLPLISRRLLQHTRGNNSLILLRVLGFC